jgi:hypothetical protein
MLECTTDNKGEIMFYVVVILAAFFAMPSKADEAVKWRQVQHSTSIQTLEVGDVNGHTLNIFRLAGIVFFADGSTGTSVVLGTSDVVNGSGSANGYGFITFSDGSELWTKWTGDGKPSGGGGTLVVTGGKGRFVGAKGDGTYESHVVPTMGTDYVGYVDDVANIKK